MSTLRFAANKYFALLFSQLAVLLLSFPAIAAWDQAADKKDYFSSPVPVVSYTKNAGWLSDDFVPTRISLENLGRHKDLLQKNWMLSTSLMVMYML